MLSEKEVNKKFKAAFWDYNIDPNALYLTAIDKKASSGFFTKEKIITRLIERLSWYEMIDLFGKDYLAKNLSRPIIDKIRNPVLRNRYEFIRKILQKEVVPDTGWSDQNRERLKASVLSDRWHSS